MEGADADADAELLYDFSPSIRIYRSGSVERLLGTSFVLAVSVDYRRASDHPLPAAYDDAWAALKWAASNAASGPEPWLAARGDLRRVFLAGDSAGANIAHATAVRAAEEEADPGFAIKGLVLLNPYFAGGGGAEGRGGDGADGGRVGVRVRGEVRDRAPAREPGGVAGAAEGAALRARVGGGGGEGSPAGAGDRVRGGFEAERVGRGGGAPRRRWGRTTSTSSSSPTARALRI